MLYISALGLLIGLTILVMAAVSAIYRTKSVQQFVQYKHHACKTWVRSDLKGRHRDHCLCYDCENFHPDSKANCPIAQVVYAHCIEMNLVTPVWECQRFRQDEYAHCRPWNQ